MHLTGRMERALERGLIRAYPSTWRRRNATELASILESRAPTALGLVDLARGAVDAHLHPPTPSRSPGWAALLAGASWAVVALGYLAEPVPPEWPGYLIWTLPAGLIGAIAGFVAALGFALRLGDEPGRAGWIAISSSVASYGLWIGVLAAATLGGPYGAVTGAAAALAAIATVGLGLVMVRRGLRPHGEILVVVGASSVLLPPTSWVIVAGVWTVTGLWLLAQRAGTGQRREIG